MGVSNFKVDIMKYLFTLLCVLFFVTFSNLIHAQLIDTTKSINHNGYKYYKINDLTFQRNYFYNLSKNNINSGIAFNIIGGIAIIGGYIYVLNSIMNIDIHNLNNYKSNVNTGYTIMGIGAVICLISIPFYSKAGDLRRNWSYYNLYLEPVNSKFIYKY